MARQHRRAAGANSDEEQDRMREESASRERERPGDAETETVQDASAPGAPGAPGGSDIRTAAQQASETAHEADYGPSPYDVAEPGTRDDRVITKGERERPGPTQNELLEDSDDEPVTSSDTGDLGGDEHSRRLNDVESTRGSGKDDYPSRRSA